MPAPNISTIRIAVVCPLTSVTPAATSMYVSPPATTYATPTTKIGTTATSGER